MAESVILAILDLHDPHDAVAFKAVGMFCDRWNQLAVIQSPGDAGNLRYSSLSLSNFGLTSKHCVL